MFWGAANYWGGAHISDVHSLRESPPTYCGKFWWRSAKRPSKLNRQK